MVMWGLCWVRFCFDGTDVGRDLSPYGSRGDCPAGRDDPWVQCWEFRAGIAYEGFNWPAHGPGVEGRWVWGWKRYERLRGCASLSLFVKSDLSVRGYCRRGARTPAFYSQAGSIPSLFCLST